MDRPVIRLGRVRLSVPEGTQEGGFPSLTVADQNNFETLRSQGASGSDVREITRDCPWPLFGNLKRGFLQGVAIELELNLIADLSPNRS